jgi:hypothetical protein
MTLEQIAVKVNANYTRIQRGTKQLLDIALETGELLAGAANVPLGTFAEGTFDKWLNANITFHKVTAYRYISLYNHKNQIASAESLQDAYKQIEDLDAQKKRTETQNAYNRVAEFRKTGVKPEGWRRGTDDKLVKEEQERDARIEQVKQDALSRKQEKQEQKQEREQQKVETERIINLLGQRIDTEKKRAEFKEKIRLSADGMDDPFQDAIMDYLDGLEDDSRRIEACYNIIKICKRIAVELQEEKGRANA